jgi:hypothetical protein
LLENLETNTINNEMIESVIATSGEEAKEEEEILFTPLKLSLTLNFVLIILLASICVWIQY